MGLGKGVGKHLQAGGSGMGMSTSSPAGGDDTEEYRRLHAPPSTMLSPSEPEDGGLDPARTLIHRRELDDQERLDLEAEKRERMLSEGQGDLAAETIELDQGRPKEEEGDGKIPNRVQQERGMGDELESLQCVHLFSHLFPY